MGIIWVICICVFIGLVYSLIEHMFDSTALFAVLAIICIAFFLWG